MTGPNDRLQNGRLILPCRPPSPPCPHAQHSAGFRGYFLAWPGCAPHHPLSVFMQVAPDAHAILILDGAGWHKTGGALVVPDNITLLPLPPYAPELNPVENV